MVDREKIKKEGIEIIEDFSKMLAGVPEVSETHYVVDMKNVTRADGEPEIRKFRKSLKKLAPKWEDSCVVAEKGV